jgi:hypothetical protein
MPLESGFCADQTSAGRRELPDKPGRPADHKRTVVISTLELRKLRKFLSFPDFSLVRQLERSPPAVLWGPGSQ